MCGFERSAVELEKSASFLPPTKVIQQPFGGLRIRRIKVSRANSCATK
jgi:hypothetical protein